MEQRLQCDPGLSNMYHSDNTMDPEHSKRAESAAGEVDMIGKVVPTHSSGPTTTPIRAVCVQFLDNMNLRFGKQSRESNMIHNALGEFSAMRLSKRETFSVILNTIGNDVDLQRDAMAILNHCDSKWGSEDFDLPPQLHEQQSMLPSRPDFLQPSHEPSFRLPSAFSLMCSASQANTTIAPSMFNDVGSYESSIPIERVENHDIMRAPSFPIAHFPEPAGHFQPLSRLSLDMSSITEHHIPSHVDEQNLYNGLYGNMRDDLGWNDGSVQMFDHAYSLQRGQFIDASHEYTLAHPESSPQKHPIDSSAVKNALQQLAANAKPRNVRIEPRPSTIFNGRIPQDHHTPPPPSTKRKRKQPKIQAKATDSPVEGDQSQTSILPSIETPTAHAGKNPGANGKAGRGALNLGDACFVHSLCGKAFVSRSKVKKHHWGSKMGDLNTTTGCWAKHGKPAASWDDDPSCKDTSVRNTTKIQKGSTTRAKKLPAVPVSFEHKAPVVPAMMPTRGSNSFTQPIDTNKSTRRSSQLVDAGIESILLPYHSHRMPSNASMNELLTVVNAEISTIQAPQPQIQNKSIVSHLNAQADAVDHAGDAPHVDTNRCPTSMNMAGFSEGRRQSSSARHPGTHVPSWPVTHHFYAPSFVNDGRAQFAVPSTETSPSHKTWTSPDGSTEAHATDQDWSSDLDREQELRGTPMSPVSTREAKRRRV